MRGRPQALVAALLAAATLAIFWPGIALYDSLNQYEQVRARAFDDWHPPIMARLWALIDPVWPGTPPLFLLQVLLYWGGIALIAAALARAGRPRASWATVAIGASPLATGWIAVVLKDGEMAASLVFATGLIAHFRLARRPVAIWAGAVAAMLLGYACLVRGNAAFGVVPLAFALAGWPGLRRWPARAGAVIVTVAAILLLSPFFNHRLLHASASQVERAQPLYDLAGIAHFARLPTLPGLPPAQWREAEAKRCYTPFFWDPYGDDTRCGFVGEAVAFGAGAGTHLQRDWVIAIVTHPLAWAEHRLGHFNQNQRFLVGRSEANGRAPVDSQPNALGLGAPPGRLARLIAAGGHWEAGSPFGWPVFWLVAALLTLWGAQAARRGPARDLSQALALSAAVMSGSYALVSIASDLRYHLWTLIAAPLALVLLVAAGGVPRRRWIAGGAVLIAIAAAGDAARALIG